MIRALEISSFSKCVKTVFPTRAIALLMGIGLIDLISTAVLHRFGLIVELNPIMKPLIETSEWLFAGVKLATLLLAYVCLASYCRVNREFVRRACIAGSTVYLIVWSVWFVCG